jgi:hypothetical protein
MAGKIVLIGVIGLSALYVGFAATVPNPTPNTPLTSRQKIAKYIKPKAVDKALDKVRDKVTDLIMYEGGKWVGGPFRGGDQQATRKVVETVIDPRQWSQAPYKLATTGLTPSQTANQQDDTPGADPATQSSRPPVRPGKNQGTEPNAPSKPDPSSHPSQSPDREFVKEHEGPEHVGPIQEHPAQEPTKGDTSQSGVSVGAPERAESPKTNGQQQTLSSGQHPMGQAQPMDFIRDSEGHYHAVPHTSEPAPAPAHAANPAPAPAAAPTASPAPAPAPRAPDRPGPSGHDGPMGGAKEIFHDHDKPDHNTPGGRDVSKIS